METPTLRVFDTFPNHTEQGKVPDCQSKKQQTLYLYEMNQHKSKIKNSKIKFISSPVGIIKQSLVSEQKAYLQIVIKTLFILTLGKLPALISREVTLDHQYRTNKS